MNKFVKIFLFMCIIGIMIGLIIYLLRDKRESFISSKKWIGEKKGYVFKKGNKGQGYYRDKLNLI